MATLALVPSRNRPAWAHETLRSFLQTRKDPGSRIVFIVDSDDETLPDYPSEYVYVVEPGGCMGAALRAATVPAVLRDATSVGMIGDDNRFVSPGWDLILDDWLTENIGVAYGDDGFQHERLPTSWWVSRPLVDVFGMAPKELRHLYMDNWWKSLGEGAGCLRYFPEVSIEHLHPLAGKSEEDAIYRRGNSGSNIVHDRGAFQHWERRGRPADVAKARAITRRGDKRRVFADWHHPALWESLSILFEDRFGWELYSPIGIDWTQHGWRFETVDTIGWAEADYLVFPDAKAVGDHWERTEAEYPERPRKLVTWQQAQAMSWDYVLASVSVHQRTFSELARRFGARLIHQVGNARHPVDRSIPQVVLASANIPAAQTRRLSVVPYHQEFDQTLFRYTEPTDSLSVTSFMLRLDWTSCPYQWMAEAPGIKWSSVGGADPRDPGYLAPMSRVADRLAKTGWVWHDKRIGDGYGHVLHTASAMGRPLIGHASHFQGLAGEPMWVDGETCIDLDRHSERDALRILRAIASDPEWYCDVTMQMRATFDAAVDFDGEAANIRIALDI